MRAFGVDVTIKSPILDMQASLKMFVKKFNEAEIFPRVKLGALHKFGTQNAVATKYLDHEVEH